jgi:hypothetical protein
LWQTRDSLRISTDADKKSLVVIEIQEQCLCFSARYSRSDRRKTMKRCLFLLLTACGLFLIGTPAARAQNHGEIGIFGEYFRLGSTAGTGIAGAGVTSFGGLGARLGLGTKWLQWEAEMGYDFTQAFTEGFTDPATGSVSITKSNIRILHGMFGPKLQAGGPVRIFLTVKGGGVDFRFSPTPVTFGTFASSVAGLRIKNVDAVLYPGGGLEAYLGPIGLRFDVGDEIYFAGGTHHNLRITFGPHFRF